MKQVGRVPVAVLSLSFCLFSVSSVSLCCYSAEPEPPPTFTLDTASGKSLRGPLRELGPGWSVHLGDARADGADVVVLRRAGALLPPRPTGEHVVFANGDRLPGKVLALEGERLQFRLGGQSLELPLSALSVIWLTTPDGADADRLARRLATESRRRDVALLRDGDTVEGVISGLDAQAVRLEVNRKELSIERSKVAAVALSSEPAATPGAKTPHARLVLRDSRVPSPSRSKTWWRCTSRAGRRSTCRS
jgi:hypothetical protein